MGTSSGCSDFWDRLGDQALVMIRRCNACPPKRSQKSLRPKLVPIPYTVSRVAGINGSTLSYRILDLSLQALHSNNKKQIIQMKHNQV